jgi:TnpA family transposase
LAQFWHPQSPRRQGGELAHDGRIVKTVHVLASVDDETHRRQIKVGAGAS